MIHRLEDLHIRRRLKIIHWIGIIAFIAFFSVLFFIQYKLNIETLIAQYTLLLMAGLLILSYISLLFSHKGIPHAPLITFYFLSLVNSVLVWATGMFQSPFIILYVILIIITSQLYNYKHGLILTVISVWGLIFMYGLSVDGGLSYYSLFYYADSGLLYQPSLIVMAHACLYAFLFLFTVFSTSSARIMLFRPDDNSIASTIQEKIIQELPMGVLVVDDKGTIIGNNPAAMNTFPFANPPVSLAHYLSITQKELKKQLTKLSKSCTKSIYTWHLDTDETKQVELSVRQMDNQDKKDNLFVVFVNVPVCEVEE